MQQAICPAQPQPSAGTGRPATPAPAPAFASLGDSLPDMNLALATVRAQAPTTPAPTTRSMGLNDPICPECDRPHKPGNPCGPITPSAWTPPLDVARRVARDTLTAAEHADYTTGPSPACHAGSLEVALRQVLDALDAEGTPARAAMPAQLLDLLTAVRDALDIPHAATTGHDETRTEILTRRISHTVIALGNVLDGAPLGIPWDTAYLRDRLAEHPAVGYVTTEQARAALDAGTPWADAVTPPACARCAREFYETDQRPDGHARHADSPWCRRCIDQCHDGGADHVCVICNRARYGRNGTAS